VRETSWASASKSSASAILLASPMLRPPLRLAPAPPE
jgi:hypothetical protein